MRQMFLRATPMILTVPVVAIAFLLPTFAGASPSSDRRDRLHQVRPDAAASMPVVDEFGLAPVDPNLVTGPPLDEAVPEPAPEPAPAPEPVAVRSPAPVPVATAPRTGQCGADVACFLSCTRAIESDSSGGYGAVSSDGQYRGAYQFLQSTWNGAVAGAGFDQYVGIPAEQVPPAVQDAAAAFLYSVRGNAPWGGRC